jgi:hypothetical protein
LPASSPVRVAPDKVIDLLSPTFLSENDPVIPEVTTFSLSPLIPVNVTSLTDKVASVFPL